MAVFVLSSETNLFFLPLKVKATEKLQSRQTIMNVKLQLGSFYNSQNKRTVCRFLYFLVISEREAGQCARAVTHQEAMCLRQSFLFWGSFRGRCSWPRKWSRNSRWLSSNVKTQSNLLPDSVGLVWKIPVRPSIRLRVAVDSLLSHSRFEFPLKKSQSSQSGTLLCNS